MNQLCCCGSRVLHHLSQASSVQQRGTHTSWSWKRFNLGLYRYTVTIAIVLLWWKAAVTPRSNRCLTSKRMQKLHFLSFCDRADIQLWKWTWISKTWKGNRRTGRHVSLIWCQLREFVYCTCWVGCVSVYSICIRVSAGNCAHIRYLSCYSVLWSEIWNDLLFIKVGAIEDFGLQMMA